jgi:hypothetical protein
MGSFEYLDILQTYLVPQVDEWFGSNPCVFQQDNAPCHKSERVTNFLAHKPFDVMEWPPYSPDMSPIENLWAIIKRKVHTSVVISKEELIARIWIIWKEDPSIQSACRALIEGMPRRVDACIRAKGGPTKY